MEKKKAIITMISEIGIGDGDVIEVTTPGDFIVKEDEYIATYEETKLSGMGGTTTVIKINGSKVQLNREGTTDSCMKFEEGKTDVSLYQTPYGAMEIEVRTKVVKVDIDENGGEIILEYDMEVAEQPSYSTKLSLKIKVK